MGSQTAQENSLFLYDTLLLTECSANRTNSIVPMNLLNKKNNSSTIHRSNKIQQSYFYPKLFEENSQKKETTEINSTDPIIIYDNDKTFSSKMYVLPTDDKDYFEETSLNEISSCRTYLKTMSQIRLVQLANAGNIYAARKLADNIMEVSSENVMHPKNSSRSKDAARLV